MSLKLLRQEEQIKRQQKLRARLLDLKARNETTSKENVLPSGNRQGILDNVRSYAVESKKKASLDEAAVGENKQSDDVEAERKSAEQKDVAMKVVAVTEVLREQVEDTRKDLDKAIYELHAQLFLNSVQRQKMEEVEAKGVRALQEVHELYKEKHKEQGAMLDQMEDRMQNLQNAALERITQLEEALEAAQTKGGKC